MSAPIEIPRIETARLILRSHRLDDFPAMQAMWSNAEVVRYIGGVPSPKQQCWSRLLGYQGHWQLMKFGYWALEEKASSNYIGELGFADFKRELTPSIEGLPELGWALVPEFHGRGYATEALQAALGWGKANLKSSRSVCLISPGNAPSLRVAAKLDYQEIQSTALNQNPILLFSRNF